LWSPDGKRIAWGDHKYDLHVSDVATGAVLDVDHGKAEINHYVWSPDSRYLAYAIAIDNLFSQVRIWDSQTRTTHEATDPMVNSFSPAWDPKGKYLYLLSDRFINPYLDRFEARFIVDEATVPCVLGLQADVPLPFAPRGDVDSPEEKAKRVEARRKARLGPKPEGEEKAEAIRVDFDGLSERLVQVPVEPGNYDELHAVEGKLHWLSSSNRGMMPLKKKDKEDEGGADLQTYDLDNEKVSTIAEGVTGYQVSMDGQVLVYQNKDGFIRIEAGATEGLKDEDAAEAKVDLSGWSVRINPRDEWKQMLHEAWRLQRDYFYDANMHGVDWDGVWKQYGPLAERIASRDDLEDMLGEMFGELNVGHAYHWGGDIRHGKTVGTGLLAADLRYDPGSGFWQIQKIYRGDSPDAQHEAPLARPDLHVKAGEWLVAIDGRPLAKGEDYLRRLADRAGQPVELSISDGPRLQGARRVVVTTVADDVPIRYATWIRENREYVAKRSNGKIGYLHLYDMQGLGLRQFARDFPPQWRKRGLIVDDRWNHGGFVAPMILAHLDRKILSVDGLRYGGIGDTTPSHAFRGYLAALINRQGGSDCETLALGFKEFKLGPVIGTRTWGGWVGLNVKTLRDGGSVSQPVDGGWDLAGKTWLIEGHGVDPDVELDLGADGLIHGKDVQLDDAIDRLLQQIATDPRDLPPAPPVPPRPLRPVP
jgi:tricorn protease